MNYFNSTCKRKIFEKNVLLKIFKNILLSLKRLKKNQKLILIKLLIFLKFYKIQFKFYLKSYAKTENVKGNYFNNKQIQNFCK